MLQVQRLLHSLGFLLYCLCLFWVKFLPPLLTPHCIKADSQKYSVIVGVLPELTHLSLQQPNEIAVSVASAVQGRK